jgi:hypothetical protein
MSLFEDLMKQEGYRKLFDMFPDDQKQLIIDSIKKLLDDTEQKIVKDTSKNSNEK